MSTAFTRNYRDHSNDTGYQFEFFCDKCGNGHRSAFQANAIGMAAGVLKAAGSLFGGGLSRAGWGASHLKDALRGPAWDRAFQTAVGELKPKFRQCTRCGNWVCPDICWNHERSLCEGCAPDLREEAAHLQANIATQQAAERARGYDQSQGIDMSPGRGLSVCARCSVHLAPGAQFCSGCGLPVAQAAPPGPAAGPAPCRKCNAPLAAQARFCGACGTPCA